MEIAASFGGRGMTERSTSHVLSFSTSVLLFRGSAMQISLPFGYWCFVREEEWSCSADQLSVALLSLLLSRSFFPWTKLPRKREKSSEKSTEARSDPIVSVRFSLKHLRKRIWVLEERDQTVPSHFWSCQFKVPIEQRRVVRWWWGAVVGEAPTPSSDLLSALVSFESWLVFIKLSRSAVQRHSSADCESPTVSLLDVRHIFRLLMSPIFPIRCLLLDRNWTI